MTKNEFKQNLLNGRDNRKHLGGEILSKEYLQAEFPNLKRLTAISYVDFESPYEEIEFFATNHLFGYRTLPEGFVPCSMTLPISVVPREGCEDGIMNTLEKYMAVQKRERFIWSIDELIEWLEQSNIVVFDNETPLVDTYRASE